MKTITRDSLRPKIDKDSIDPSLEKHKYNIPFPEKLAKANEILRTVKLPKNKHHQ
jgi:hypothetical protein